MVPRPPNCKWRVDSSDSCWIRDLDECEDFYRLHARTEDGCYPITACATFRVKQKPADHDEDDYTEKAFRNAWVSLRHRHPTLGSFLRLYRNQIVTTWRRVYIPFEGSQDVSDWALQTFYALTINESAHSWFNRAPAFTRPTIYLIKSKSNMDYTTLFLRCPHDTTDRDGIFMLLQQLFDKAAYFYRNPPRDYPYPLPDKRLSKRLSPSLRVAEEVPELLPCKLSSYFQRNNDFNRAYYNLRDPSDEALTLPSTSNISDAHMKRIKIAVPQPVSGRFPVLQIRALFQAALAMALCDYRTRRDARQKAYYIDRPMVCIRSPTSYLNGDHAAAAHHTVSSRALVLFLKIGSLADHQSANLNNVSELAARIRRHHEEVMEERKQLVRNSEAILAPWNFKALHPSPGTNPWAEGDNRHPAGPVFFYPLGELDKKFQPNEGYFETSNVWLASQPIRAGVAVYLSS
ncbi:hypothetical protein NW768_002445 [Fusarium equiseti]|uniref:Uncharacterized protein n=1 Tax=Fusarium equiseti TaxID=61235 RepID=A0ABQ8RNF4_FUSEQ|nr:hypothetical protein NW768_002445 [Fusarium equiseti]